MTRVHPTCVPLLQVPDIDSGFLRPKGNLLAGYHGLTGSEEATRTDLESRQELRQPERAKSHKAAIFAQKDLGLMTALSTTHTRPMKGLERNVSWHHSFKPGLSVCAHACVHAICTQMHTLLYIHLHTQFHIQFHRTQNPWV